MTVLNNSTREAFMQALTEISEKDSRHVLVSADSILAARAAKYLERWPQRVFEAGIAEQSALNMAAGLAATGLFPYVVTYAGFITMRACEQMRSFIAYPSLPVRLVGLNGGLFGGEREGVTHQFYEDLAITRAIPGMTVLSPADAQSVYEATLQMASIEGPVYLRLGSGREPAREADLQPMTIGKIQTVMDNGSDVAICSTGFMLNRCLAAARQLEEKGIGCKVIDVATLKPLDSSGLKKLMVSVSAIITVEDHNIIGGLGSALSEFAAENHPLPIRRLGLQDVFGRSGHPEQLLDAFGLSVANIVKNARGIVSEK